MYITRRNIILLALTLLTVFYAEWIYPKSAIEQCKWPEIKREGTKIALIADPQIVDANTYPGRNFLFDRLTRSITDRFVARNYRLMKQILEPEYVMFLGDLFDGGREWANDEWKNEYRRFTKIFPRPEPLNPLFSLPGNHDVGSGETIVKDRFFRFRRVFGEANRVYQFRNIFVATLDTNALMSKDADVRQEAQEYFDFMKESRDSLHTLVILSHVPLARPENADCGKNREKGTITNHRGYQYQNMLNPELTQDILNEIRPNMVFSGDDHDACEYVHVNSHGDKIVEHTVKSFSMASGIQRPGFQLLNLESMGEPLTDICLVHKPWFPIFSQIAVIGAIGAYIIISAYRAARPSQLKEKDDLPVSDTPVGKSQKRRRNSKYWNMAMHSGVVVLVAFIVGQYVVNRWSYSSQFI